MVAEIKWVHGPRRTQGKNYEHTVKFARQDIFKLGRAVEQRNVRRGYMIVGAPVPWWDKVRHSCDQWIADLIAMLETGCDARPADDRSFEAWWQDKRKDQPPAPRAITLSPLRSARVDPSGDDCWELRCVRVTTPGA